MADGEVRSYYRAEMERQGNGGRGREEIIHMQTGGRTGRTTTNRGSAESRIDYDDGRRDHDEAEE